MTRRRLPFLLLLALLGAPSAGNADEDATALLARARREKEALQYARALDLLDRAFAAGGSHPDQVVEIVRMAAEVAAGLEQPDVARSWFERLLVLEPDASYPPGTSPKIADPFARARSALRGRALVVRHEIPRTAPRRVVLMVGSDPLDWVAGANVRYTTHAGRRGVARSAGRGRITVSLPADATAIVVAAVDAQGNELVAFGSDAAPIALPAADLADREPSGRDRSAPRPVWARWYWWVGGAAILAGAASIFGLMAPTTQADIDERNARSDGLKYEDTLALERRGQREALFANVGFALAGATALAGALVLVLTAPEADAP